MQQRQINKPISVNLDKSKKYLTPTEAFYMLNRERNINGTGTLGKTTPLVANYLACMVDQPAGDNYNNGHCFSEETNELYWWTYNTNGVHYVGRLNGDGTCQIVYDGDCLELSAAPEHSIEEWRCYLKYDRFCANQHGKQLIWTNGDSEIGQLDVEASIATDSFRTPFFTDYCPDPCAYTEMCVPEPCGALEGEFVALPANEADLNNKIVDIGIKVAFFHIYYDQRESTMSDISTLYFQDSKGCFDAEEGFPRCIKFTVPLGNPMVDKIEIVYSTDNGLTWKSSDIIEKYQPYANSSQYWYQRELADLTDLDLVNCTFSYNFCNDKECNPVSPERASRVFNPMPRKPQGLIRIKNSLGFYNYLKGNCPISGAEAKKFEVSLNCNSTANCNEEIATVTVRAIVHNVLRSRGGLVFRLGGKLGDPDDDKDAAIFGASRSSGDMMQSFSIPGKIRNFIPYIDASNSWGQMKQWKSDAFFVSPREVGIVSGMSDLFTSLQVFGEINSGSFYYQEFQFRVKKGTRGYIRLAGHSSKNGLPSEGQLTSTHLLGTIPNLNLYKGDMDIGSIITYKEEIYFDTCSGDVELDETIVVEDNFKEFTNGAHTSSAYSGYVTDANNVPVEGAIIYYNGLDRAKSDHNGFYHFNLFGNNNNQTIEVNIKVETNCVGGFNSIKTVTFSGSYGQMCVTSVQITDIDFPNYKNGFYQTVTIPVTDCDNLPVGGVRVALSGSKYQVTDGVTGIATFKVRNYSTRNRSVMGVVMDIDGCFTLDCSDGCNPCLPVTADTLLPACFIYPPNTTNIATTTNLNKTTALLNKKGLKNGGRYPFGFVVKGGCGRISAVYPATVFNGGSLPELDNYINIPKTQEQGALRFCSFAYDGTGMVLPDWAECVAIVRGENVNNYELQWVVDKIERTADRKIRLTIQSLNDYNATYNFETNTLYQYVQGDRVEFISNGNGDIYDITTFGLLNYQVLSPFHDKVISGETESPANFFNQILINDDGSLDDLTVGAKIELQRPKTCTPEPAYFEIEHLPVIEISGQRLLQNPTGTFTTFDTFIVTRQIGNSTSISYPPQQFEHKFPSDFWGHDATQGIYTGLSDVGKVHFTNAFENERRFGRNITINSETRYNRFGNLEKTLDAPEQGDVIAMAIYDGKIGLGIGEFDSFLFQVSDEFLRLGSNGLVQAAPADALVSDTQPKISGIFGCRYQSIGSIFFGDGFVTWVDIAKSALVKHDFNVAKDISQGKFNTWVKKTVQFMENFNRTAATDIEKYRFFTGMNYHTGALQLTAKALNQNGINNEQQPFISYKSTLLIEPNTEELLTFASYTPEGYGNIVLNNSTGAAFVAFYNGVPYIHPIIPIKYNEFFGTAVDAIIGIAINQNPEKIKRPTAIEIQSQSRFYVTSVKVDDTNFDSFIPPIRVIKKEDKWNTEFLCNVNARGGVFGTDPNVAGQKPRGYFCAVTFVRDNTLNLAWNTTDDTKRVAFDELDLILFKYQDSEQSGFTGNL